MTEGIHLVVPEVNGELVRHAKKPQIIANPNCSTIQLVVALKPLQDKFGLKDVRVASYQAVSGAGLPAYDELVAQVKDLENPFPRPQNFPHPIAFNLIPQIGSFNETGFCSEELKIMRETRKILSHPTLRISAFTVRVPVLNAHSEAVWVELNQKVEKAQVQSAFRSANGLVYQDDPTNSVYPQPREVSGKDPVFVGRLHRDLEDENLWMMWIVSDNLRKGAALNGIQIAEWIWGE
jgi:aspartate-semialdehyde dehydrogenase